MFLVFVFNIKQIIKAIFDANSFNYDVLSEGSFVKTITSYVVDILTTILTPNIATFILWLFIGLISYVVMELILDETKGIKDILLIGTSYKHPEFFNKYKYWFSFLIGIIETTIIVILLVLWVYLIFEFFIPFSNISLGVALLADSALEKLQYFSYSVLGMFTSIVGLLVFIRLYIVYKLI